jgi:hypothetical protein
MIDVYDQPLVSNGYTLSSEPHRLGYLIPSDPQSPLGELREQYAEQGYLWLKGILDRDAILAFRKYYFELMEPTGIIAPGTDPGEGIASGQLSSRSLHDKLLMELVRTAAYEAFCLDARIWQFYDRFLDGPTYLHKR